MPTKSKRRPKSDLPRELERAGALCLAFANSGVPRRDDRRQDSQAPPAVKLATYADFVGWVRRMRGLEPGDAEYVVRVALERPVDARAVLAHATNLRDVLHRLFTGLMLKDEARPGDLDVLNAALVTRRIMPEAGSFRWAWDSAADALERPLWPIAQSAGEMLTSEKLAEVRQCAARGCWQLFVRRHPRRRWCDMNTCGNRLKGQNYQRYLRSRGKR